MELVCIKRTLIFGVLAAICVACMATTFFGQGIVTGSISGTVEDAQGAVVPAANVQAVRVDTGTQVSIQSDSQGYFEFKVLPNGSYTVTIEAKGFTKLRLSNVLVEAGKNTALGTQRLEVGGSSEVVVVEASTPLIESSSSQIGATFEAQVVRTLPHGLGGFDNLALYIPGMVNTGSTNFSNTNGAAIANNGLRGRSNNFQIDGQANNDNSVTGPLVFLSNPDVIAEVQVVSNNFSAEYGRNSGTVVNYITKSGTNSFHGSAGYLYDGNWLRSLTNGQKNVLLGFCAQGVAAGTVTPFTGPKGCRTPVIPRLGDNRFGGTFGGPVLKNRVWFFASYQQRMQRAQNQATSSSITPTPAGIAALASAFPGNAAVTALQQFGPFGIKAGNPQPSGAEQMIPVSNGTTSVQVPFAFVTRTVGDNFDDKQITGRGDWQISNKDRFFFRFIYQNSNNALGSGTVSSGAFVAVPAEDRQYGWDYTRIWSTNFVQQFRVSYGKGFFKFAAGEAFPQCTIEDVKACPPNISFAEPGRSYTPFGLATNLPQDRQVHNTQIQNNSTWTHGRHGVKFGGEFDHQNSPNHFLPSINGGFQFFSNPVVGPAPAVNAFSQFIRGGSGASCPPSTGNIFNGICSQLSLTDGQFNFDFKENDLAFYAQDDWRVRDNLTLNLGLRWEWTQQAINLLHDITVKNVADGFWAAGLPTNVTVLPKIPEAFKNFGPNIGFAWRPRFMKSVLGEDKTVIRGGYRIAYDPAFYNIFLNMATLAPVVNAGTIRNVGVPASATGTAVQAAYLGQIPRGQNPGGRNQTRVSPDFHNPYVQQWSLGVERLVTSHISFDIRYVGNHGVGNFQSINANPLICSSFDSSGACTAGLAVQAPQFIPAGVQPCTPAQATAAGNPNAAGRPDCNFTLVRTRTNGAWSIYHGLQNEVKVRAFRGLTATVAYTWSKALDNTSEIFASTGGNSTPISLNPFDSNRMERGVSAQSYPHVFTTYWLYDLPWMRSQQGLLGHILGGWQVSGTYVYQSGVAVFPIQNTNNGDPYCDASFNNNFIGAGNDSCRPLLSNRNAPFNTSGRYVQNATTRAVSLINVTTCQDTGTGNALAGTATCSAISPSDVHFIVNNTLAINALCGGNPFACAVGRNLTRTMPRNNVDLSLQKNLKINERLNFTLRGDALNAFNYQFLGAPGLNVNNKNINGVTTGGAPAPDTFGETWGNNGTFRTIVISGRITF